jgi:hypothetical protein
MMYAKTAAGYHCAHCGHDVTAPCLSATGCRPGNHRTHKTTIPGKMPTRRRHSKSAFRRWLGAETSLEVGISTMAQREGVTRGHDLDDGATQSANLL